MNETAALETCRERAGIPPGASLVDVDVHVRLPDVDALFPYLDAYVKDTIERSGRPFFYRPHEMLYPPNIPTSGGVPRGAPPESAAEARARFRRDCLDPWRPTYALASVAYFVDMIHNPYIADAMARAINDWLIAEWLDHDSRLVGSLLVSAENPSMAVREIERLGSHPKIVQVLLPLRSSRPYGNLLYRPIFEAAAAYGLVVGIHYGGWPGAAPTAIGWPSYYIEEWIGRGQIVQTQLMSLIAEGLFVAVPSARVSLLECGWAWLPAFLWRFDKDWKGLHRDTPWIDRAPSSYLADHVRFSLQPADGPDAPEHMRRVLDQIDGPRALMFSSDYPHRHFDGPEHAIPIPLLEGDSSGLLFKTACRFYGLQEEEER